VAHLGGTKRYVQLCINISSFWFLNKSTIILSIFLKFLPHFSPHVERFGCLRRFASPNKDFAQQRPGVAKCAGATAWEWIEAK
jgi:hypothetical protein